MKRIIYGSLSVLTAVCTVFLAAKAEVFEQDDPAKEVSSTEFDLGSDKLESSNSLLKSGQASPSGDLPSGDLSLDGLSSNGLSSDGLSADTLSALAAAAPDSAPDSTERSKNGFKRSQRNGMVQAQRSVNMPSTNFSGSANRSLATSPTSYTPSASTVPTAARSQIIQAQAPQSAPTVQAPVRQPLTIQAPATQAPTTQAPATQAPTTQAPAVQIFPAQLPAGSKVPSTTTLPAVPATAVPTAPAGRSPMQQIPAPANTETEDTLGQTPTKPGLEDTAAPGLESAPGMAEPMPSPVSPAAPDAVEPDAIESDAIESDAIEPDTVESDAVELDAIEPDTTDVAPDLEMDSPTAPTPISPVPSSPVPASPVPAAPGSASPAPISPVPASPGIESPVPTSPVPSSPVPAAPDAQIAEPAPSDIDSPDIESPSVDSSDPMDPGVDAPPSSLPPMPSAPPVSPGSSEDSFPSNEGFDAAPDSEAFPESRSGSADSLVGEGFTPFQLSYLAIAGGLQEEGIPGGDRLVSAYKDGDLSATDIVEAGASSNRLGAAATDRDEFTKGVDRYLKIFRRDARSS